ncbi:MAG TPA: FMN-binding protein [Burkholderiaceae bacterium]|nr:FMN-binding protein [Burkholderiaceae bacterium]
MRSTIAWLPVAALSTSVYATTYLDVAGAQQAIFPGASLAESFVTLSDEQRERIEKASGVHVVTRQVRAWRVAGGGVFIVDEVIGKHDAITYALGIDAAGGVKQVEIMAYRENYGYEIRGAGWRRQFAGKTASDPVRLDQDIRNISGATLSCRHVTDGVRRLLATYEVALKP